MLVKDRAQDTLPNVIWLGTPRRFSPPRQKLFFVEPPNDSTVRGLLRMKLFFPLLPNNIILFFTGLPLISSTCIWVFIYQSEETLLASTVLEWRKKREDNGKREGKLKILKL
ncbi:hypothetical protein MRB53_015259 [Persea americana]|uniref:Uncharacterized protein n=1 Tax=Persea americana TaxID=3435 RepID=A0ACC2KDA1_PERAE|nr:hypothetical protein MRB53_015259 [Persea americana]